MRAVIQRVSECDLSVDGIERARIGRGLVCYLGIGAGDQEADFDWMVKKVAGLRLFPDDEGRMNFSILDVALDILVVPQFTLYGDVKKGFRPSFSGAEAPDKAKACWEAFVSALRVRGAKNVQAGVFGADMTIRQVNSGPVTIVLDSRA
jgi:D-tyrosyl-tRNA(Tyr) deacylase